MGQAIVPIDWGAGLEFTRPTDAARKTAEGWARPLRQAYGMTLEAVIEQGRLLTEARDQLSESEWSALLHGDTLPYGRRTAYRYMSVASHELLGSSDLKVIQQKLPASHRALSELSTLQKPQILDAIESGDIRPDMTVGQVTRAVRVITGGTHQETRPVHDNIIDVDYEDVDDPTVREELEIEDRIILDSEHELQEQTIARVVDQLFPSEKTGLSDPASRLVAFLSAGFGESVTALMQRNHEPADKARCQTARRMIISMVYTEFGLSQPAVAAPFGHESSNISRIKDDVGDWDDYEPMATILDGIRQICQGLIAHDNALGSSKTEESTELLEG